jgi:hypothetical protein
MDGHEMYSFMVVITKFKMFKEDKEKMTFISKMG